MLCMNIWGHPYIHLCKSGVDFGVSGVDLSQYDVVMSLLRLQQASNCILHPYWIHTKHFGTLIDCVWAYGPTLTVMCLCRSEVDFEVLGVDLSPCDVIMSLLRPQQHEQWKAPPPPTSSNCISPLLPHSLSPFSTLS